MKEHPSRINYTKRLLINCTVCYHHGVAYVKLQTPVLGSPDLNIRYLVSCICALFCICSVGTQGGWSLYLDRSARAPAGSNRAFNSTLVYYVFAGWTLCSISHWTTYWLWCHFQPRLLIERANTALHVTWRVYGYCSRQVIPLSSTFQFWDISIDSFQLKSEPHP